MCSNKGDKVVLGECRIKCSPLNECSSFTLDGFELLFFSKISTF